MVMCLRVAKDGERAAVLVEQRHGFLARGLDGGLGVARRGQNDGHLRGVEMMEKN